MPQVPAPLPRVTIQFCTQCKWMLRAAYFAQELLSTFGTSLGEVSLQPVTGGTFIISIYYVASQLDIQAQDSVQVQHYVLWDRKIDGGFPETKEVKRRVRDIIDPGRDLGHVDGKKITNTVARSNTSTSNDPYLQVELEGGQKKSGEQTEPLHTDYIEGKPTSADKCRARNGEVACEKCDKE